MAKLFKEHRSEPKFWTDVLITMAVFLDWLPSYLQATALGVRSLSGVEGLVFSGSKLVILPLLMYDIYTNRKYWFGGLRVPLICAAVGMWVILPVIAGNSPLIRAQPHIANLGLLFYYLQRRSLVRCALIMKVSILCAAMVPLSQILAQYGLLKPLDVNTSGGGSVDRVFAVTRTGTIGVYSAYCLAFMGGLLAFSKRTVVRWGVVLIPISLSIMVMALLAPLFTGQRSVALIVVVVSGLSFINLARYNLMAAISFAMAGGLACPLLLVVFSKQFSEHWYALAARFSNVNLGATYMMEGSAYFRLMEFQTIWAEFIDVPDFIAPGVYRFIHAMGNVPHSSFGHLYYDGGVMLILIYMAAVTYLMVQLLKTFASIRNQEDRKLLGCFISYFVGYILVSFTMPIMNDRIVGFTIGMAFCLLGALRSGFVPRRQFASQ